MSTEYEVKSVTKVLAIITALASNDFRGMTNEELAANTGITLSACYRMLKTLEKAGWVRYSEKTKLWTHDTVWAKFSRAYDRAVVQRHNEIDEEYFRMTGEVFSHAKSR